MHAQPLTRHSFVVLIGKILHPNRSQVQRFAASLFLSVPPSFAMGLLNKLQTSKFYAQQFRKHPILMFCSGMELKRLEERYVKRANRNVWQSDAQYVDGEYVYTCRQAVQSPPSRSAKKPSNSSRGSSSSRPSTEASSTIRSSKSSTDNAQKWRLSSVFNGSEFSKSSPSQSRQDRNSSSP